MGPAPSHNQIKAFLICAIELNFSNAATNLNLTQSAISSRIVAMESFFGFPLFARAPRGVSLTKKGQALFFKLQRQMEDLEATFCDFSTETSDLTIKISVTPTFASTWLINRLPNFIEKFPDIDVQIISSAKVVDLFAEDVDCVIRHSAKSKWPRLKSTKLFTCLNYPMCSPQLLKKYGIPKEAKDLLSFPLIHSQTRPEEWNLWFQKQGVKVNKNLGGQSFQIATMGWEASEAGLGLVFGDLMVLNEKLLEGKLVIPYLEPLPVEYNVYFVYPETFYNPAVKKFRAWLLAETKSDFEKTTQEIKNMGLFNFETKR